MSPLVRAASLTHYSDVALTAGLDPGRMLAEVGLSASALKEPDLKIPAERVRLLLERSAELSGVESFGLRMAESRQLSNLGAVGMLMRDQPTLRDSLGILLRYMRELNGSLSLMIEETDGLVVIREEVMVGGAEQVRQAVELAIGVMLRLLRNVLGPNWWPRQVCFSHPAPADLSTHRRVLGRNVEFNQEFNGIVFTGHEFNALNAAADPAMARYAQQLIDASLGPEMRPNMVEDVRRTALLLLPSGRCTIEQVADQLGVVCRTVQRRLSEQGISFSTLVNELRVELAARHVLQSDRPLTDVAALLGFSAPSAFSRWYHQQFGCSPTQARALASASGPNPSDGAASAAH